MLNSAIENQEILAVEIVDGFGEDSVLLCSTDLMLNPGVIGPRTAEMASHGRHVSEAVST